MKENKKILYLAFMSNLGWAVRTRLKTYDSGVFELDKGDMCNNGEICDNFISFLDSNAPIDAVYFIEEKEPYYCDHKQNGLLFASLHLWCAKTGTLYDKVFHDDLARFLQKLPDDKYKKIIKKKWKKIETDDFNYGEFLAVASMFYIES